MQRYLQQLVQFALGVAIAGLAYAITLLILGKRQIITTKNIGHDSTSKSKQHLQIVKGYMDAESMAFMSFNTLDPFTNGRYLGIQRSHNRYGGAQFTYSFWIYMSDTTDVNVRGKDILLRGDARRYWYTSQKGSAYDQTSSKEDIIVKCPRVRFGRTFKDIVVEFNTLDNVMDSVFMGSNADPIDTTMRHNVMSVMQNKWALITLTFEDHVPINDFENGLVVRMFVNDVLFHTQRKRTTLRQNTGNFYLFPSGGIRGCRMGGVSYYNYALGFDDVRKIFRDGRPKPQRDMEKEDAVPLNSGVNDSSPAYLTAYNKIDLYNR